MKKAFKIIVPLILVVAIIASIGWYLFVYDRDFARDILLQQARFSDMQGSSKLSSWFYNLAYEHSGQDPNVAIELANQYKADGNYTKAEFTLANAIADSATVELYIALCKTYVEQDKLLDAVNLLENIGNSTIKAQLDAIRPAVPEATYEPGFYNEYISIALSAENGSVFFSAVDKCPSVKKDAYAEPFTLPAGETSISVITVASNGLVSPLVELNYTVGGVIEAVSFTDGAIEASIRELLGVDEDGTIMTNDLWTISEYTVPADAKSFGDLAYLPYLTSLTVEGHSLSGLSFLYDLGQLEELTLTDCKFPDDDLAILASLPILERLTLSNCSLSTVADLANAQNLTYLDLSNNTIRNLEPLSGMITLQEINLQHNAVTTLSALSSLSKLEKLDVSYNSLTDLASIATCVKLSWLDASHNTLSSLGALDNLPNLQHLNVSANALSDVSLLASCVSLTELNIANNSITDISGLSSLIYLKYFDFSYNQVTQLPNWSADCALYSITGSYNSLESIDCLKDMENLAYVYMDYNLLTSVDALGDCYNLVLVNVYGNEIRDVSALTAHNIIVNYDPTVE